MFTLDSNFNQLRFAIQLLYNGIEAVLLVESFGWIEVYYNGLPKYCPQLCKAIKDAVSSCADLLSYEPSALECTVTVLCQLPHSKQYRKSPPHPVNLKKEPEEYYAHCSIETHLSGLLTDERQTCWLTTEGITCSFN